MQHLDALELRLSHERERLTHAGSDSERALRAVWIAQIEREIAGELVFLGNSPVDSTLSLDDLMKELES